MKNNTDKPAGKGVRKTTKPSAEDQKLVIGNDLGSGNLKKALALLPIINNNMNDQPSKVIKLLNDGESLSSDKSYERKIKQVGKKTYRRHLALLLESQSNEEVILPFGDLSKLIPSAQSQLQTYLGLIAMRYSSIAQADWDQVPLVMNAAIDDENANHDNVLSDELKEDLKDAYGNASRKYIEQSVISPLLRRILVQRGGVKTIDPGDVLGRALTYSQWKSRVDTPIIRQLLVADVVNTTINDKDLESFSLLIEAMATGVKQNASIALPILVKAVIGDDALASAKAGDFGKDFGYDASPDDQQGFTSRLPLMTTDYTVIAHNVEGKPWILEKELTPSLPIMTTQDVATLIQLLAQLQGIDVARTADLEMLTRYSELSIMVIEGNLKFTNDFNRWFSMYSRTQFLIEVTQLKPVDNMVASIFDEPNRADLHAGLGDRLYFFALSHKVAIKCISNILTACVGSVDVDGDSITAILKTAGVSLNSVQALDQYELVQRATSKKASLLVRDRTVVQHAFYMDPEIAPRIPVLGSIYSTLNRQGAINELISTLERHEGFFSSASSLCCLISNEELNQKMSRLNGDVLIKQREEFDDDIVKKGYVTFTKANDNAVERAFALMLNVAPTTLVNMNLEGVDKFSFRTSDVTLDTYDLRKIFLTTVKADSTYAVWLTDEIFKSVEGETATFDTELGFITDQLGFELKDFLSVWALKKAIDPDPSIIK